MSSATRYDIGAGQRTITQTQDQIIANIRRLGMSERQQELNLLWARYRGQHYDTRRLDWDGRQNVDAIDHEVIATQGYLPDGFYDASGQMNPLPLKFRKPTAPYNLCRVIVDRFTGLLFSEKQHPQVRVQGDPNAELFVRAIAERARLWPTMMQARTMGGAMGTVAMGFQFIKGRPTLEIHDPRWLMPQFKNRLSHELLEVEKRYMYPIPVKDEKTGAWTDVWYWYRRIIDEEMDTIFQPAPVGNGAEPQWVPEQETKHSLGFVPVVWTQNLPVVDEIDGDPDCQGIMETVDTIDADVSQANRGALKNSDPTVVIVTDARLADVKKGSDNAIKLPPNSSANYMEITGSGIASAMDISKELRARALEVAQCVLEHPDTTAKTATEIERMYSSMMAKADQLKEQYTERCIKPILAMMIKAARATDGIRSVLEDGTVERASISLPKEAMEALERLGDGEIDIALQWGAYFQPGVDDILKAVDAAARAKAAGLLDKTHAANFVASYFHVEDVDAMLRQADKEQKDAIATGQDEFMGMMKGKGMGGGGGMGSQGTNITFANRKKDE